MERPVASWEGGRVLSSKSNLQNRKLLHKVQDPRVSHNPIYLPEDILGTYPDPVVESIRLPAAGQEEEGTSAVGAGVET